MLDIISIARECPGMMLTISASDLVQAQTRLIDEVKKEMESMKATKETAKLKTREEVLDLLNVVPSTLWRWRKSGYLVPINVGGQYRYRSSDIEQIMEGTK